MIDYSCHDVKNNIHQRYQVLMDAAPFGLILIGLDGVIIDVNACALKMLGSPSKEETQTINMLSYQPLEDSGVSGLIRKAVGAREPISDFLTHVSKWGATLKLKATACSIRDTEDIVCFVAFLMEDVTELEELKNKYNKIAKTLVATVDALPDHIWLWAKDRDGIYHVANKSYAEFFKLGVMDIIGKTDCDIWPYDFAAKFRADDTEVLTTCGTMTMEEVVYHPKYGSRRIITTKTAICNDDLVGELVVGMAEDITDEYARKEAAKRALSDLKSFLGRSQDAV
jgi:PAS domain S-box-containing protein